MFITSKGKVNAWFVNIANINIKNINKNYTEYRINKIEDINDTPSPHSIYFLEIWHRTIYLLHSYFLKSF